MSGVCSNGGTRLISSTPAKTAITKMYMETIIPPVMNGLLSL
jgi:hypothetical protein